VVRGFREISVDISSSHVESTWQLPFAIPRKEKDRTPVSFAVEPLHIGKPAGEINPANEGTAARLAVVEGGHKASFMP
jgi:hypothetical protein